MATENLYLFRPTDQDMRIEYPELAKEPVFNNNISISELKFIWYYANRTSPYFTLKNGKIDKIKKCIKKAFSGTGNKLDEQTHRKYLEGNFPQKIKDAIPVMEAYNPSARIRARFAIESIFDNLVGSLELSKDMKKSTDEDLDEKKKYMELSIKVSDSLPNVIAQLEEGYGIRTSSFFGGDSKMSVMDLLHTADKG